MTNKNIHCHPETGMGAADAVLALAIGLAVMGVGAAIVHDRQEASTVRTAGAWINDLGYAAQAYAKQHFDAVYQTAGNNGLVIRTSQLDRDPDGNGPLPALGTYLRNAVADDALGNQARVVFRRGSNANQIQVVVLSDLDQQALPAGKLGAVLEAPGQYGFGVQKNGSAYQVASPGGASSGYLDSLVTAQQRNGVRLTAITADTRGYGYSATVLKGPGPAVALITPPAGAGGAAGGTAGGAAGGTGSAPTGAVTTPPAGNGTGGGTVKPAAPAAPPAVPVPVPVGPVEVYKREGWWCRVLNGLDMWFGLSGTSNAIFPSSGVTVEAVAFYKDASKPNQVGLRWMTQQRESGPSGASGCGSRRAPDFNRAPITWIPNAQATTPLSIFGTFASLDHSGKSDPGDLRYTIIGGCTGGRNCSYKFSYTLMSREYYDAGDDFCYTCIFECDNSGDNCSLRDGVYYDSDAGKYYRNKTVTVTSSAINFTMP